MAKSKKYDVVVAGHICFDFIPALPKVDDGAEGFSKLFIPGKLVKIGSLATSTGGPVSNTGLGLKKLGINVTLMGKVGDDFIGKAIIERLKEHKFEKTMTVVPGENTSYTIVICPPGIDRLFLHYPGTNDTFGFADVNFDIVKQTKIFHLGYPPSMERLYRNDGKELIQIFKEAKKTGATTSLDMALPDPKSKSGHVKWRKILEKLVPYVDIYLPSAEETLFMLHPDKFLKKKEEAGKREMLDVLSIEEIAELGHELLRIGGKITAIKCGYKGYFICTKGKDELSKIGYAKPGCLDNWSSRELFEPAYQALKIASATGSGDSSISGFLSAYLRGCSIEECIRTACAVGWHNVQVMDAVSGIKTWEETQKFIKAKKQKNIVNPSSDTWQYDKKTGYFIGPQDKK